jgi:hypothetical protein
MKRKHKYGAQSVEIDGHRFPSKKEAKRYLELKILEKAGRISELRLQVRYKLVIDTVYVADFVYREKGEEIVEDVKGHKTRVYLQKKRLMKKQHGIEIKET